MNVLKAVCLMLPHLKANSQSKGLGMTVTYAAIDNLALGEGATKGDCVIRGDERGVVQYGTDCKGVTSPLMGFITVANGTHYIVTIRDQLVFGWEKIP